MGHVSSGPRSAETVPATGRQCCDMLFPLVTLYTGLQTNGTVKLGFCDNAPGALGGMPNAHVAAARSVVSGIPEVVDAGETVILGRALACALDFLLACALEAWPLCPLPLPSPQTLKR